MKELFRERDFTRIGYCQSILEEVGIATHVRNRDLVGTLTEVPIPEFFPALCVVNEADYQPALDLLKERMMSDAAKSNSTWTCEKCGEEIPGSFEMCWNCETPAPTTQE